MGEICSSPEFENQKRRGQNLVAGGVDTERNVQAAIVQMLLSADIMNCEVV